MYSLYLIYRIYQIYLIYIIELSEFAVLWFPRSGSPVSRGCLTALVFAVTLSLDTRPTSKPVG